MSSDSLAPFYGLLTRPVQRARLAAARPHFGSGRVLDLGCGLTDLPGTLPSYVGCDREELVLAECRRRYPEARFVRWDLGAADAPPELAAERFDVVLMLAILEHLDDPAAALRRAAALLAEGGTIVTTTPHPLAHLPLELGARLGLLSSHAGEEHEDLLGRPALERAASAAGLRVATYRRFLLGLNQLTIFGR